MYSNDSDSPSSPASRGLRVNIPDRHGIGGAGHQYAHQQQHRHDHDHTQRVNDSHEYGHLPQGRSRSHDHPQAHLHHSSHFSRGRSHGTPSSSPEHVRRVTFGASGSGEASTSSSIHMTTPHQHNKRMGMSSIPTTADKYLTYDKYQMSFDNQLKTKRKQKVSRLGGSKSSPCLSSGGNGGSTSSGSGNTGMGRDEINAVSALNSNSVGGDGGEPVSPSRYRSNSADLTNSSRRSGGTGTDSGGISIYDAQSTLVNGIYMTADAFTDDTVSNTDVNARNTNRNSETNTNINSHPRSHSSSNDDGSSSGLSGAYDFTFSGPPLDTSMTSSSSDTASATPLFGSLMTRLRGLSNASSEPDTDGDMDPDAGDGIVYEEIPIRVSVGKYIYSELFVDREQVQVFKDSDIAERNLMKFISVPLSLEYLIWFGLLICADAFLYIFTFLPLRFLVKCLNVITTYVAALSAVASGTGWEKGNAAGTRSLWKLFCYDTTCIIVIMIACTFLQFFDMSYTYHFIRGQTMIKLYVITAMLEVVERLLCSFGEDSLSSMHNYTQSIRHNSGLGNLSYMLLSMGVYTLYVVVHSCFYFIKVATLTVAFNTTDQSFISILVLNNFAEMKAHVFKKFDGVQLFELTCADIAERFQVVLFLICMMLVACAQSGKDTSLYDVLMPFVKAGFLMNLSETVSDWIKHAYINKFNRLDPNIYDNFSRRLRSDLLISASSDLDEPVPSPTAAEGGEGTGTGTGAGVGASEARHHENSHLHLHEDLDNISGKGINYEPTSTQAVGSHNAMRKIGLTHIPLACVFIRYMIVASYMPRTKLMINQCCCWVIQATYFILAWFDSREVEAVTCSCRSGSYRSGMTYALIAFAVFSVLVCVKVMLGLYLIYHCVIVHNSELTEVKNDTKKKKKSRKHKQKAM